MLTARSITTHAYLQFDHHLPSSGSGGCLSLRRGIAASRQSRYATRRFQKSWINQMPVHQGPLHHRLGHQRPVPQAKAGAATGRPRDDAARQAVLQATAGLLEEVGFNKLSIEGIAARAGVAKTTIYRWWQNKGVLALEAFLTAVSPKIAFPETAAPLDDLRVQVHKVGKLYRGKTGRILCELLALSQADSETHRQLLDGYLRPRRAQSRKCLERAAARGLIRQDIDIEIMIDAIYGPLWHRMTMKHAPLDTAYIDAQLDLVLHGLKVTPRR